jgi:hypothetical protein
MVLHVGDTVMVPYAKRNRFAIVVKLTERRVFPRLERSFWRSQDVVREMEG